MRVAITGHANLEKALGYEMTDPEGQAYNQNMYFHVMFEMAEALARISEKMNIPLSEFELISGMARGVDELFALTAHFHNIPLILSIPNSIKWHKHRDLTRDFRAQAIHYDFILQSPVLKKYYEIKKDYDNGSYQFANFARNQHMVDISDIVISYKVLGYDSTGTDDCIKRAQKINKYYGNVLDIIQG
jgi:hypothetical protein